MEAITLAIGSPAEGEEKREKREIETLIINYCIK